MNSRILDVYPKIPLFTTLLLFTITFFVYDDFGIRMIFGYAALMYVALIYLIFRNNNLRVTRMKALYLILALNLSVLILSGSVDSSSIAFVIGIVICALVALVGDVRRSELPAAFRILILFSILIAFYVVAVRFYPSLYLNHVRPHLSAQSQATNEWLIKEGYGVTLGGNIVFIDYVLTLCGLICFNLILAYKEKLKFRWLYWGCIGICAVGMLFVNRKSEILAYATALFFCFWMHMGASTRKEKKRILIAAIVLLIAGVAALSYLATIDEKSFLESVLLKTLSDPENEGLISRTSKDQVIIAPPFSKDLLMYCCPDGMLHDFQTHFEVEDKGPADDDDMKAHRYSEYTIRTCKACGYQRIS